VEQARIKPQGAEKGQFADKNTRRRGAGMAMEPRMPPPDWHCLGSIKARTTNQKGNTS